MWAEAASLFAAHRRTLAARGIPLAAKLEPCAGLLSAYTPGFAAEGAARRPAGKVMLALPDQATTAGRFQAMVLAGCMGVTADEVSWLFRALLPRLVAHEIGHALRAEFGRLGADMREEEQVAERLGDLLSRPLLDREDRARARELLEGVLARLGGAAASAALHRHAARARDALGLHAPVEEVDRARAHLQTHYHRDFTAYLRTSVAWTWIDLSLEVEDSLDDFYRDHLALAP